MNLIREAFPGDLPVIRDLAHAIWPTAYGSILSPAQLAYMLDLIYSLPALERQMDEGQRFLLLESEGAAAGFAGFGPLPAGGSGTLPAGGSGILPSADSGPSSPSGTYKLHKLYVLPTEHGKGRGRLLLEQVIEICRALEASTLLLNVNRNNKARHFYERMGFRVVREEDIPIGQRYYMNDYIMEYILSSSGS